MNVVASLIVIRGKRSAQRHFSFMDKRSPQMGVRLVRERKGNLIKRLDYCPHCHRDVGGPYYKHIFYRVIKGGYSFDEPVDSLVSYRGNCDPEYRKDFVGFRLIRKINKNSRLKKLIFRESIFYEPSFVTRGSSWLNFGEDQRSALRDLGFIRYGHYRTVGFRLLRKKIQTKKEP